MNRRALLGVALGLPLLGSSTHAAGRRQFVVVDGRPLFAKGVTITIAGGLVEVSDNTGPLVTKAADDVLIEVD